jgi:hypothetical protein
MKQSDSENVHLFYSLQKMNKSSDQRRAGHNGRTPCVSPVHYLRDLLPLFDASDPIDSLSKVGQSPFRNIDRRLIIQNLKVRPKLPPEYAYIKGLQNSSQLQMQWITCAQNMASVKVWLQFFDAARSDANGFLKNTSLLTGVEFVYDVTIFSSINLLYTQFADLYKILQHRHAFLYTKISERLVEQSIVHTLPRIVIPLTLNLSITCRTKGTSGEKDESSFLLIFRKQMLNKHVQCPEDIPKEIAKTNKGKILLSSTLSKGVNTSTQVSCHSKEKANPSTNIVISVTDSSSETVDESESRTESCDEETEPIDLSKGKKKRKVAISRGEIQETGDSEEEFISARNSPSLLIPTLLIESPQESCERVVNRVYRVCGDSTLEEEIEFSFSEPDVVSISLPESNISSVNEDAMSISDEKEESETHISSLLDMRISEAGNENPEDGACS